VQAVVMNITDNQADYVREVEERLRSQGFRVNADLRNEKIGFKIREHTLQKVPYLIVIGDREVETQTLAVRACRGDDLGTMDFASFTGRLQQDIADRGRVLLEE
jgi:threonyl-tRNA synthetase